MRAELDEVASGLDDDEDARVRERDDHALQELPERDREQRTDGEYQEFARDRYPPPGRGLIVGVGASRMGRLRSPSMQGHEQDPCCECGRQYRRERQPTGLEQSPTSADVDADPGQVGQQDRPAYPAVQPGDGSDKDIEQYHPNQLLAA